MQALLHGVRTLATHAIVIRFFFDHIGRIWSVGSDRPSLYAVGVEEERSRPVTMHKRWQRIGRHQRSAGKMARDIGVDTDEVRPRAASFPARRHDLRSGLGRWSR